MTDDQIMLRSMTDLGPMQHPLQKHKHLVIAHSASAWYVPSFDHLSSMIFETYLLKHILFE